MMRPNKRQKLERKGWRVGTVRDFLGLSEDEAAYVELRLRLADSLKNTAQKAKPHSDGFCQADPVQPVEGSNPSVSLDLLIRSLLALGASSRDLARTMIRSVVAVEVKRTRITSCERPVLVEGRARRTPPPCPVG